MIEDTAGEGAGGVAHGAVFGCRHMVGRLAERIGAVVAGVAACRRYYIGGVVDECTHKARRVMARATIRSGYRMIKSHAGCRGSIVAGDTRLGYRIEDRVIEYATQVKRPDAMAHHTIHARHRMILRLSSCIHTVMTGDTACRDVAVVHIRR